MLHWHILAKICTTAGADVLPLCQKGRLNQQKLKVPHSEFNVLY